MLGCVTLDMSLYEFPELYDELFPVEPQCIRFYTDLARAHGGPVLELACGTGQLTGPIADLGFQMVGIDNAPAMVGGARRRLPRTGSTPLLFVADMRQFEVRAKFPFAFVARNSLLHLTAAKDLIACLRTVRRHLATDGVFAFDVFNPDIALLSRSSDVRFPVMRLQTRSFGEVVVEETISYDWATQVNRATWHIVADGTKIGAFPLHLRSIFPDELPGLVEHCGFRLEARFGNYDQSAFSSRSVRQVAICRVEGTA